MVDQTQKPLWIVTTSIAFSPLVFGLILYVINPEYMSTLLKRQRPYLIPPYFPLGWAMTVMVLFLVVAASLLYWYIGQKMQLGWGRIAVQMAVFIFLVVPAYFILILGPGLVHVFNYPRF